MKFILDTLKDYVERAPYAVILYDDAHTKGLTYAQFDEMTGRVYAYLKSHGIGREDFVLIDLPRGVLPVVAMLGVWKAGAAWALVEDTYAPERINYIRSDCSCKLDISAENWDEIMHTRALPGYEPLDDHAAAYAIYTSGTTGNPKGVLHEYGNLQRAIDSITYEGKCPFTENDRLATLAPMNFVATVIVILAGLNVFCGKNFIVSYATIKNPAALAKFFITKRITITFMTPSYVRKLSQTGPFLRMLFVGSEPANNIYNKNVELINIYAASESGFAVGFFPIDKPYEVCPIGKPQVETTIYLRDENGADVPDGETGELCFVNPYVRGYINLPEETKKAFVNGIYHTGDLARRDENGNLVLLGRKGDMIKINGNRIEPAEIEAAVKEALGIDWVAARGFDENGKSFLCAYYTADIQVDTEALRKELMKRLPYYMIPAYYMKIDTIPMKASGKMDRKALPAPNIDDFINDYVEPANDTEKALCDGMAKVLKLSRVGIHDDFYEMGGDSLSSIELITVCEEALPGLNAGLVFRGRTPEKIAELYGELLSSGEGNLKERNLAALAKPHPLTPEQLYMIDYQLYTPNSTMYNLFSVMKMDKELFDPEKLAEAMETAIKAHPALLTSFEYNDDGELVQCYKPENFLPIHVEKLSEFEFRFVKDTLVFPFKIVGGRMYRCRIFETEKAVYTFFDVHHSLFDGTSLGVFLSSVRDAYLGMPIEPDYYYLMLQRREEAVHTAFYEESRKYFEERFEGVAWSSYPEIDHQSRENEMGELFSSLGIEQPQMNAMERAYKISRNEFFITVAALSISIYNNAPDVKLSWIYNGREDLQSMTSVGLLFRDLPVGFHFRDSDTLRNVFADVHEQVQKGIEHCCYPYVDMHNQVANSESAYLLYQRDIRDMGGMEGFDIETVDVRQNQAASQTILDMEILDGADGLQLMIDYAASRYEDASIERFMELYVKLAQTLVTHNSQSDVTIGEVKAKISDKRNFFQIVKGFLSRKK